MNLYANQQRAIKGDTTTFVPLTKAELMVFINPLRTVVTYMHQENKYFIVCKQIIITSPAFTL